MAVLERLKFLHKLPLLLKGTSDDAAPCPGYLYEEIAKISYESPASCRCLLEHLLNRLQSSSCYVKLKVLKILQSLCSHGSLQFVQDLRRNASFIQEATDVSGPLDLYHGHSLYQKVRAAAQDLVGSLFSDSSSRTAPGILSRERAQTGMGSQSSQPQTMQGFGYSQEGNSTVIWVSRWRGTSSRQRSFTDERRYSIGVPGVRYNPLYRVSFWKSSNPDMDPLLTVPGEISGTSLTKATGLKCTSGEAFLNGIQRAAVAVTHAVLPGVGSQSPCRSIQVDDTYRPVAMPYSDRRPSAGKPLHVPAHNFRVSHRSGVPGGGWDESDSGHSSQESSQDKSPHSRSSDAASKSGSDGQSRSSTRESTETPDRVEPTHPGDCLQEAQLVWTVIRGHRVFLTREEVQHFVRGCSLLNCEVVFEMLNRSLMDENSCTRMRSMCAISALMTSDLLSHDHMLAVVRTNLQKLSQGSQGPVTDKATKILRQFEALTQNSLERRALPHETEQCTVPSSSLDLLNDAPPLPEEGAILTPVSLPSSPTLDSDSPNPADCSGVNGDHSEGDQSWDSAGMPLQKNSADRGCTNSSEQVEEHGHVSLFDGMELVCLVKSHGQGDNTEQRTTDQAPTRRSTESLEGLPKPVLPSVFTFLNS